MALHSNDLVHLVSNIFEIDSYASKMGSDNDVVVLSFTVEDHEPATDLVNFIERGYEFSENIPTSKQDYEVTIKENSLNNFSNFFNRSFIEAVSADNEDLIFQKMYSDPLRMRIKGFGTTQAVYESLPGRIMLESKDMAEVLFLSKYLGNYNITKVNGVYVFENSGYAVALEKL